MSYDVALLDPVTKDVLMSPEHVQGGGTYPMGGRYECQFNITYNYADVFGSLVRELDEQTAEDTLPRLEAFVASWPNVHPYIRDYWAPTPGNAKAAVEQLIVFAKAHPQGVWSVS